MSCLWILTEDGRVQGPGQMTVQLSEFEAAAVRLRLDESLRWGGAAAGNRFLAGVYAKIAAGRPRSFVESALLDDMVEQSR